MRVPALAGKVEQAIDRPARQLAIAEGFFGRSELVERYRALIARDPKAHILQIGHYYSRPPWMEEMARARELYRLATQDPELLASPDCVPVEDWISDAGMTAEEQWALGFGLSSTANAWDGDKHPHVPAEVVDELLDRAGLSNCRVSVLGAIAADRSAFQVAFPELHATGKRFIWELSPFNTWPFLRLEGSAGLLLLGRPWMLSWLSGGFHYRAMRVAQAEDAAAGDGRTDHVQRYTAYAGQVFEA